MIIRLSNEYIVYYMSFYILKVSILKHRNIVKESIHNRVIITVTDKNESKYIMIKYQI